MSCRIFQKRPESEIERETYQETETERGKQKATYKDRASASLLFVGFPLRARGRSCWLLKFWSKISKFPFPFLFLFTVLFICKTQNFSACKIQKFSSRFARSDIKKFLRASREVKSESVKQAKLSVSINGWWWESNRESSRKNQDQNSNFKDLFKIFLSKTFL